jgi:hypothetical protein
MQPGNLGVLIHSRSIAVLFRSTVDGRIKQLEGYMGFYAVYNAILADLETASLRKGTQREYNTLLYPIKDGFHGGGQQQVHGVKRPAHVVLLAVKMVVRSVSRPASDWLPNNNFSVAGPLPTLGPPLTYKSGCT